jgi:hypothetical protein
MNSGRLLSREDGPRRNHAAEENHEPEDLAAKADRGNPCAKEILGRPNRGGAADKATPLSGGRKMKAVEVRPWRRRSCADETERGATRGTARVRSLARRKSGARSGQTP